LPTQKPFTINAKQTKHLIALAREKNLFLMEAVWTRFFPLSIALQRMLFEEKILGKIHRVFVDFGLEFDIHNISKEHRLLNPDLGGGALLDLGIYTLTWVMMTCFQDPENQLSRPVVSGSMLKTPLTGVDEFTNVSLLFPKTQVSAVATTNMTVRSPETFARVQGDKVCRFCSLSP
jgi:predicted dehydrogenase